MSVIAVGWFLSVVDRVTACSLFDRSTTALLTGFSVSTALLTSVVQSLFLDSVRCVKTPFATPASSPVVATFDCFTPRCCSVWCRS